MSQSSLRVAVGVLLALVLPAAAAAQGPRTEARGAGPTLLGTPVAAGPAAEAAAPVGARGLFGRSGKIRATVVNAEDPHLLGLAPGLGAVGGTVRWFPLFERDDGLLGEPVVHGTTEPPAEPGIFLLERESHGARPPRPLPLAVITGVPFARKQGGHLNGYHIGRYPTEGSGRTDGYAPPAIFIEVTPENQDFEISENFRLRQFLTKDQADVWPKYLALDLRLIDKLELVLQELNAMGVRADRMHVMSGYRTPQYNGPGGDGRAALSRHTYGDAADVWVDSDGNGYMDDLNGDGRIDLQDTRVMLRAVERVERKYPELVGGAGLYPANGVRGPFVHIDVRGTHARW